MTRPTKFDVAFALAGLVLGAAIVGWAGYLVAHPPKPPTPPAVVVFP